MFLQELATEGFSDGAKFVSALALLIISNIVTYLVTRPKSESEIRKNVAETHKSEADTMQMNLKTIKDLTDELDEMIVKVKGLRTEVGTLEDITDELKDALRLAEQHEKEVLEILRRTFAEEKATLLVMIENLIDTIKEIIDWMRKEKTTNDIRLRAVLILETLYNVRDKLKIKGL